MEDEAGEKFPNPSTRGEVCATICFYRLYAEGKELDDGTFELDLQRVLS